MRGNKLTSALLALALTAGIVGIWPAYGQERDGSHDGESAFAQRGDEDRTEASEGASPGGEETSDVAAGTEFASAVGQDGAPTVSDGANASENAETTASEASPADESDPADSEGPSLEEGAYVIRSAVDRSKALDVDGASFADGANVHAWSANGTNAQRFWISCDGSGGYRVQAMCSGKALDVAAGGTADGTNVQQWLLDQSTDNQRWSIVSNDDGSWTFVSMVSGLALDIEGASAVDGANVQTWAPNGTAAQRFYLERTEPVAEGFYTLQSTLAGDVAKAVDVTASSRAEGANVQLWTRNDSAAQKFELDQAGEGLCTLRSLCSGLYVTVAGATVVQSSVDSLEEALWSVAAGPFGLLLTHVSSGLVLDVAGAGCWDGVDVGVYQANGTRAQGFFLDPVDAVSEGTYLIRCASDGRVLDVDGGTFGNGVNVQTWDENGTGAQAWYVRPAADGCVTIVSAKTGKALDVLDYGAEPGTNVQVWDPVDGVSAQLFRPVPTGDGYYCLQSACNGLYVDVAGGGGYCGANVQVWTPNQTSAQKFSFEYTHFSFGLDDVRASIGTAATGWDITSFGGFAMNGALRDRIQAAVDSVRSGGNTVGFIMVDVATGQGVAYNPDTAYYSASTIKGPYVVSTAAMYPGSIAAWASTMESTIRWSSNEGYSALRAAFGPAPIWEWCLRSSVDTQAASAQYVYYSARDLLKLWVSNYEYFTTDQNGGWVGSWFTSSYNSQIYYQLGPYCGTQSKPGWTPWSYLPSANDAGIVWSSSGAYLMAVLSDVPGDTSRIGDVVWALEDAHRAMSA